MFVPILLFLALAAYFVLSSAMKDTSKLANNKPRFNRPSRSSSNELGSGDLATKAQIARWLGKKERYATALPVREIKGSDGLALKKGSLIIPADERNRHILVIAKTGSGKTTRAILPVLYEDCLCPDRSSIVIDSKPEMWDKLVGLTRKWNPKKKILLFNPLDTKRSLSWNILAKIETDTDAKLIANTIITATDNPSARMDSPFFRNSALQLLNSMMVGLLLDPNEKLSMPRVHELLNSGIGTLCDWLEAHPQALRNSKTFVDLARSGSQNADTILSEMSTRLSAWDLRTIRATTAFDELDLESLIAEPTLFIVELRESELEMLRPLANVIVIEILRYLTKRAEQLPMQRLSRPVSIVIDEFASSLGRLPDIHVKLNTLRSRNVSIVAAIQSIAQIKANYDKDADSVLAGFSTKILMPNLDFMDSDWASKETGIMTVRYNVASVGKNRRLIDFFANRNDNLQEQVQQRPVLTADEIGRPNDNVATFFMPNTPAFQGHLVPYYEVPEINQRFEQGRADNFSLRSAPIELESGDTVVNQPIAIEAPKGPGATPPAAPAAAAPSAPTAPVTAAPVTAPRRPNGTNREATPSYPLPIPHDMAQLKLRLGAAKLVNDGKDWWDSIEDKNSANPAAIVSLLQQIYRRKLQIAEFHILYRDAGLGVGAKDLASMLATIDRVLLDRERAKLAWDEASPQAKQYWKAFEDANGSDLVTVRELAMELTSRGVTVDDFFRVSVHSGASSVAELLAALDDLVQARKRGAAIVDADRFDGTAAVSAG